MIGVIDVTINCNNGENGDVSEELREIMGEDNGEWRENGHVFINQIVSFYPNHKGDNCLIHSVDGSVFLVRETEKEIIEKMHKLAKRA